METTLGQVKALREEQPQASVAAFKGAFKLRPKDAQEPAHKEQSRNIPEIMLSNIAMGALGLPRWP